MQLDRDMDHSSSLEVMALDGYSVGHVVRNTLREIIHKIRVVGLISTLHRKHRLLGMLVREFLKSMQYWRLEDHQASIIEMHGKIFDQVVSILIDPRSNYSYVNPGLVDKCGLRK